MQHTVGCTFTNAGKCVKGFAEGTGPLMHCVSCLFLLPSPFEAIHPSKGEKAAQGQEGSPH